MKQYVLTLVLLIAGQVAFGNDGFCDSLNTVRSIVLKKDASLLGEVTSTWEDTIDYRFGELMDGATLATARTDDYSFMVNQFFGKPGNYDSLIALHDTINSNLAKCGIELSVDRWGVLRAEIGGVYYSLEMMELYMDEETEETLYRIKFSISVNV